MISVTEGFTPFHGHNVSYRIVGEREEHGRLPLLCLHGGPGVPHNYLEPLEAMAATGRRVIFYDQLGCGNSDHPHDPSLWTVDLFVEEVGVIRRALGLDRIHLLGQSWGGMLAMQYALTQPSGLASLTVGQLSGQYAAVGGRSRPSARAHPEVHNTMNGPSEFHVIGVIRDWDITARLGEIRVPTLITSGRHDEATPAMAETVHRGIRGSECVIFEHSAHLAHAEEPERYVQVLDRFLPRVEEVS